MVGGFAAAAGRYTLGGSSRVIGPKGGQVLRSVSPAAAKALGLTAARAASVTAATTRVALSPRAFRQLTQNASTIRTIGQQIGSNAATTGMGGIFAYTARGTAGLSIAALSTIWKGSKFLFKTAFKAATLGAVFQFGKFMGGGGPGGPGGPDGSDSYGGGSDSIGDIARGSAASPGLAEEEAKRKRQRISINIAKIKPNLGPEDAGPYAEHLNSIIMYLNTITYELYKQNKIDEYQALSDARQRKEDSLENKKTMSLFSRAQNQLAKRVSREGILNILGGIGLMSAMQFYNDFMEKTQGWLDTAKGWMESAGNWIDNAETRIEGYKNDFVQRFAGLSEGLDSWSTTISEQFAGITSELETTFTDITNALNDILGIDEGEGSRTTADDIPLIDNVSSEGVAPVASTLYTTAAIAAGFLPLAGGVALAGQIAALPLLMEVIGATNQQNASIDEANRIISGPGSHAEKGEALNRWVYRNSDGTPTDETMRNFRLAAIRREPAVLDIFNEGNRRIRLRGGLSERDFLVEQIRGGVLSSSITRQEEEQYWRDFYQTDSNAIPYPTSGPTQATTGNASERITEVLESGPGYVIVRYADGRIVKRTGTHAWRDNNPGNILMGDLARQFGAIGIDPTGEHNYAVFPTLQAGENARRYLLFEDTRNLKGAGAYKNMTIREAITQYAPPSANKTEAYISTVTDALGLNEHVRLNELNANQIQVLLDAMKRQEGFSQGEETYLGNTESGIVNDSYNNP